MKVNQIKNTQSFNGLYDNKLFLSSLEAISDHGASFIAATSFVSAVALRPAVISLTPKVEKDNKKALSAESIVSGIAKLAVGLAVAFPVEKALKNIRKEPEKFLKKETIEKLSKKDLDFLSQTIKMSANFISAIPKSILGVAVLPVVMDLLLFKKEKDLPKIKTQSFDEFRKQTSFSGGKIEKIASDVIDSKFAQEFAKKNSKNNKNIARNMSVATDILLTTMGCVGIKSSKKIDKKSKKPLILNKIFSTAISILAGCTIDKTVQKIGNGFVENFKKVNLNNPKLPKYLEGLNIVRPTIIFALIYYGVIPLFSTYFADRFSKNIKD